MDHSDKSPSIPLFQRGKWMPIPLGCVYRHSPEGEGTKLLPLLAGEGRGEVLNVREAPHAH